MPKKATAIPLEKFFERHITKAEADKGHITIREGNRSTIEAHFGPLHHEVKHAEGDPRFYKTFVRKDTGETISLKLCMRNRPRREMRLYLKKKSGSGYTVKGNSILMIDFSGAVPVISSRSAGIVHPEKIFLPQKKKLLRPEDEEQNLNALLNKPPKQLTLAERKAWARPKKQIQTCLKKAGYACEAGMDGDAFDSRATRKRYLEVHHLIPLKQQEQFNEKELNLNDPENLCCLSPQAHRALHHGTDSFVEPILCRLFSRRPALRERFGISEDVLLRMYGIE
jgi:hypothetical protein